MHCKYSIVLNIVGYWMFISAILWKYSDPRAKAKQVTVKNCTCATAFEMSSKSNACGTL